MIATTAALTFGAGVSLAADYQDNIFNVCEGTFGSPSCSTWGSHVTGSANVAMGFQMMPSLTTGSSNVALNYFALRSDTSGNNNIASGVFALTANTTGSDNIATGLEALEANGTGGKNVAIGTKALWSNTTGSSNVASGVEALRSNTTGSLNIASGTEALFSNTNGGANLASGFQALKANTAGSSNVASGVSALLSNTTGSGNIASGTEALLSNTEGSNNVASGPFALAVNTTGSANVAFGSQAGANLTTGSNNIDISNLGVAADAGTTRIGSEGTQTRAFVAGVYKKPVTTPACGVKVNSEGQLGCNPQENSTAIATFASRKAVASGSCLNYTDIAPAGTGACPAATTGYSGSNALAGPTPANGATVTSLSADSNAVVSGTDTVLVAVIDNTTGATLLSCTVNSTTKSSCSDASGSGAAAAGDNIEVKLTATGASGNSKLWRVTFRF
jgi:hypothetical protein